MLRQCVGALVVSLLVGSGLCAAQTRRALLIGIDEYAPPKKSITPPAAIDKPRGLESEPSRWDLPVWPTLEGAVNDALAMKETLTSPKFGFPKQEPYMKVLTNQQATRQAILDAMRKYLLEEPAKGDVVVFYYAGHGSQRYNSKSTKPRHLDETIVPVDANGGGFDIRDKEIARIFNSALNKGVKLTAIFDSCHSGSVARGIPLGSSGASRFLGYDPRDANDPEDGSDRPEDRKDNAALVLTATQHDQFAREWVFNDEHHGAFTIALIQALRALPANTPASDVYKRVKVVMQGMGLADQQPALGGVASRPRDALLGSSSESTRLRVAVAREGMLDNGRIVLDAGKITGIGRGSELVSVTESKSSPQVRIRVVELDGMNKSLAELVSPSTAKLEAGDLFELDKWIPAEENRLQVWMAPATLSSADLDDFAAEMSSLRTSSRVRWIDDPSTVAPTHIVSWNGTEWVLQSVGGASQSLGTHPTSSQVLDKIGGNATSPRLFVNFPTSKELAAQIKLSQDSSAAIELLRRPQLANYLLSGRLQGANLEYAWILRDVIEQGKTAPNSGSVCGADTSFPLRTDWTSATSAALEATGHDLTEFAARLAKVKLWLSLRVPPGGGESDFPYELALKRRSPPGGSYVDSSGSVTQGEVYDLVLHISGTPPVQVDRQWVYVLGIDCAGRGSLLYPAGPEGNQLPERGAVPTEISLTGSGPGIKIVPPFGLDSYVLLTTTEQLPDPSLLEFNPVLTRGARGPSSPLGDLLGSASSGRRGMERPVPSNWAIHYLQIRSAALVTTSGK
jgi:hypothetical protein